MQQIALDSRRNIVYVIAVNCQEVVALNGRWNVFAIVLGMMAICAQAQWPTSPEQQLVVYEGGLENIIISDGAGGAFVFVGGCLLQKLDNNG